MCSLDFKYDIVFSTYAFKAMFLSTYIFPERSSMRNFFLQNFIIGDSFTVKVIEFLLLFIVDSNFYFLNLGFKYLQKMKIVSVLNAKH